MSWSVADLITVITVTHFLSSISVKNLNRLKAIHNTICWIVCKLPHFSSTNFARKSLDWLPLKLIQFKNVLLTYKSLHTDLCNI